MMSSPVRKILLITAGAAFLFCCDCGATGGNKVEQLREQMVKRQIADRGVRDQRVLDAIGKVERHKFVPEKDVTSAYGDFPLPIGHGQTISQPYIVALMTELCELDGSEKVLEIGTGSGYQAAVLGLLADEVYTIEIVEYLGKQAKNRLKNMNYDNVHVRIGDGYKGWPEEAPFDVIIVTAAPPEIPRALIEQLDDGGIMVVPVGEFSQELVKLEKRGDSLEKKTVTYVRFVPMVHGKEEK